MSKNNTPDMTPFTGILFIFSLVATLAWGITLFVDLSTETREHLEDVLCILFLIWFVRGVS